MNLQYLIYKHVRKQTPYQKYIKEKQQIERKKERTKFYDQILKFSQSRYPQELMNQLQRQINPFQLSLDKLKQVYNAKYPQYSNQLVHQAVQYVFKRKCQQSEMIKQSSMVIEYGDQDIRNGRKLQKEDFSYFYEKLDNQKRNVSDQSFSSKGLNTDREKQDSLNSKLFQEIQAKTQKFNKLLMNAINDQKDKFENIQLIQQDNQKDSLYYYKQPTSRRDLANNSFPKFKESDLLVKADQGMETGRSDIEELNQLLGGLTRREEDEMGELTGRSRGSSYTVKINKEVMDNLYNARGKLKLDLVKRVVNKFKRQKTN